MFRAMTFVMISQVDNWLNSWYNTRYRVVKWSCFVRSTTIGTFYDVIIELEEK